MPTTVDLIFAEFGPTRQAAGDAALPQSPAERLEPALSSFLRYFPEANTVIYTDQESLFRVLPPNFTANVRLVTPPFDPAHARYGWRCNDYYKIHGLRESTADVAIALDADMLAVSPDVRALIPLAMNFGLLAPMNPRWLVRVDARSECDGSPVGENENNGIGFAFNGAPWAACRERLDGGYDAVLETYLREMRENPCRLPVAMWRAVWWVGIHPYMLPPQFCICAQNIDVPNPIIAHVGHEVVRRKFIGVIE